MRCLVQIEQFANLRKRQAQPLAADDELDAHALAFAVDAAAPVALRRQQSFVLVKPDRAGRQRELLGEIGDTVSGGVRQGRHRCALETADRGAHEHTINVETPT